MRYTVCIGLCILSASIATRTLDIAAADEKKTPHPLEQYRYPKAEAERGAAQTGNMYCETLTTADDFNKVAEFYHKKIGKDLAELKPNIIQTTSDGRAAIDASANRSVSLRIWVDQTDSYSLTVVVSRTADEKSTHIAISYWKRK